MAAASYSNDVASPEVEIASEATGGFFSADIKNRNADLKAMLDSNKDGLKLEAMKRIINMVAKGKDASDLFPAVVKNVAAKNHELKKLVYVYLVRYAEEQQDLALLSISTFQRALKDPNQLIRASALRVLSSIRVGMIVPIMMLALKESVRDMSPYVRKTAAHAIPKLYSLDPEQKDQLIEVIDHLLADRTTLVVGSAVFAFEEVCPERIDIIHKHYRKHCQLLVDVDEWGQVMIINMLTRYARSQFTDPNDGADEIEKEEKFYSSEEEDDSENENETSVAKTKSPESKPSVTAIDPDLKMLLLNTKPLLQSRNAAVVLAVAQLYYHLAPKNEVGIIARALIRLLRSHREVQSIVLTNIATISAKRRNMFEPFLKSFFVRSSDPTHIKLLKLEILTNLATQGNISIILREFQTYVAIQDKEFAAATIDAIGRCASNIKEVTNVCLAGLVNLMANRNETVVAQSVVVIKKLLQMLPAQYKDIIISMAKLIDKIQVPAARASILWLIGEYCERVPKIAPDVLRKMAKSFVNEEEIVKAQILNLAVKLYLTNPEQTQLLLQYVFTLARYDTSYDLRDRARFLKNLIVPQKPNPLSKFAKSIFLSAKPAPVIESRFKDRDHYQLGTLSHYLNQRCSGYNDLPEFPKVAPDPSVRNVALEETIPSPSIGAASKLSFDMTKTDRSKTGFRETGSAKPKAKVPSVEKFYSDEEEEEEEENEGEEEEEEDEESEEEEEGEESEEEQEQSGEEHSADEKGEEESSEEEEEESEEEGEDESESEEEQEVTPVVAASKKSVTSKTTTTSKAVAAKDKEKQPKTSTSNLQPDTTAAKSNADLLLDFDFDGPCSLPPPVAIVPTAAIPLVPSATTNVLLSLMNIAVPTVPVTAPAQFASTAYKELLNRLTGHGLSVNYRFTRAPSIYSSTMCTVELQLTNGSDKPASDVRLCQKKSAASTEVTVSPFPEISQLPPAQSVLVTIGIDFSDSSQPAELEISAFGITNVIRISAPFGEQMQPIILPLDEFTSNQGKLSGMNETSAVIKLKSDLPQPSDKAALCRQIYSVVNVIEIPATSDKICFAGRTVSGKIPVYISLTLKGSGQAKLCVNCEKVVVSSMVFKDIKAVIAE